jgi:hypothetical protein
VVSDRSVMGRFVDPSLQAQSGPAMPRYFFNVIDGRLHPDIDGTVLRDIEEARIEAVRLSGDLLRENPARFWSSPEWRLEVVDEAGQVLFALRLMAETPARAPRH